MAKKNHAKSSKLTEEEVDVFSGICVAFLIASGITSFVGLGIDWEWELMDNDLASGINIFVPVVYGMVRGRSIGRFGFKGCRAHGEGTGTD